MLSILLQIGVDLKDYPIIQEDHQDLDDNQNGAPTDLPNLNKYFQNSGLG